MKAKYAGSDLTQLPWCHNHLINSVHLPQILSNHMTQPCDCGSSSNCTNSTLNNTIKSYKSSTTPPKPTQSLCCNPKMTEGPPTPTPPGPPGQNTARTCYMAGQGSHTTPVINPGRPWVSGLAAFKTGQATVGIDNHLRPTDPMILGTQHSVRIRNIFEGISSTPSLLDVTKKLDPTAKQRSQNNLVPK